MENTTLNPAAATAAPDPAALNEMEGNTGGAVAVRPAGEMGAVSLLSDPGQTLSQAELSIAYGVGWAVGTGIGAGALGLLTGRGKNKTPRKLVDVGKPLTVVCNGYRECWREWLPTYQEGVFPKEFASEKDANDGKYIGWDGKPETLVPRTTKWSKPYGQGGEAPQASQCAYLQLLVRKPDDVDAPDFCLNLEGNWYCPAWMRVDKTLYQGVHNQILLILTQDASRRKVSLKEAKPDGIFLTLTTYAHMKTDKEGKPKAVVTLIMAQKMDASGKAEHVPATFLDEIKRLVMCATDMSEDDGEIIDTTAE